MQISLKLIRLINHAKWTVCIKFQLLVIFSSLFTDSSITPALLRTYCTSMPKRIILGSFWFLNQNDSRQLDGSLSSQTICNQYQIKSFCKFSFVILEIFLCHFGLLRHFSCSFIKLAAIVIIQTSWLFTSRRWWFPKRRYFKNFLIILYSLY